MAKKTYLVKVIEKKDPIKTADDEFITVLNYRLWKLINKPMQFISGDGEVEYMEKDVILCDGCNDTQPEYVMTDGDYLSRTVCEKCRQRYFKNMEIRGE